MNEKINNVEQICSVKRMRYVTGRAKDLEVMIVNNGKLCFELIVDKCLDIHSFYHKGTSVAFISANGLNVSETEFSSVFNGGLLYTCGLDTIGGRVEPIHGRSQTESSIFLFLFSIFFNSCNRYVFPKYQ